MPKPIFVKMAEYLLLLRLGLILLLAVLLATTIIGDTAGGLVRSVRTVLGSMFLSTDINAAESYDSQYLARLFGQLVVPAVISLFGYRAIISRKPVSIYLGFALLAVFSLGSLINIVILALLLFLLFFRKESREYLNLKPRGQAGTKQG